RSWLPNRFNPLRLDSTAERRSDQLDAVGPDVAVEAFRYPRQHLDIVDARRARIAGRIGTEQDHLAAGRLHPGEEAVRPSPQPGRDIDGHHDHGLAAGGRDDAAPAIGDIAQETLLQPAWRPDLQRRQQLAG